MRKRYIVNSVLLLISTSYIAYIFNSHIDITAALLSVLAIIIINCISDVVYINWVKYKIKIQASLIKTRLSLVFKDTLIDFNKIRDILEDDLNKVCLISKLNYYDYKQKILYVDINLTEIEDINKSIEKSYLIAIVNKLVNNLDNIDMDYTEYIDYLINQFMSIKSRKIRKIVIPYLRDLIKI